MCPALWLRFAAQSLPLTWDSEGDFYPSKLSGAQAFASFTVANVIGRRAYRARSLALTRDSEGDFYSSKLSGALAFASFTVANVIGRRARPAPAGAEKIKWQPGLPGCPA